MGRDHWRGLMAGPPLGKPAQRKKSIQRRAAIRGRSLLLPLPASPRSATLVSLDSPVGQHEGGQVAAPVFKRIAEQVLPYLDVPRDVPIAPRLVQAAYKRRQISDSTTLEDFTPADFSGQPDQPPAETPATKSRVRLSATPPVTVAVQEGGDIEVPDLAGRTM